MSRRSSRRQAQSLDMGGRVRFSGDTRAVTIAVRGRRLTAHPNLWLRALRIADQRRRRYHEASTY
jgi:hypothetical protein